MKQYRNYKRQYETRAQYEKRILRRAKVVVSLLLMSVILGMASFARTVEYVSNYVTIPLAQAEWKAEKDVCGLKDVVCEDEQPVEVAIKAVSDALGREVTDETKNRIKYLYERAIEASVPFYDAVKTIYCESQWYAIKSWLPEESYGIAQIHVPSHDVTVEQALDPYFSIDFLVDNWEDTVWYGYDRATGRCANGLIIELW